MARHAQGILGEFSGKVGTVIGGSWKGIPYMRGRSLRKKNRNMTEAQVQQQARFRMATQFIRAMNILLNTSYEESSGKTNKNLALKQLLEQSIGGVYPDLFINYSTVYVAKGSLKKADNPAVAAGTQGMLNFSWTDTSGLGNSTSGDKAILVAYCPGTGDFMFNVNAASRSQGNDSLDVRFFSGKEVHTWISFRSADGKQSADSIYTGKLLVP
ncbi:MAG: hypothetical protein HZA79_17010 [Sphingobacteriales bacterium]|nr:hypothetical protein [Sphingobacteriales bacterium]